MQKEGNLFPVTFFLLVVLISNNIYSSKCLQVVDCVTEESQSFDPHYEEIKQELANEIDDVNDYMQMVADELTNDGVIVVRAETIKFNIPDVENNLKSEIIDLGSGDASCCYPEETTILLETCAAAKTDEEFNRNAQNQSLIDAKLINEIEDTNFENDEKLQTKIEHLISTNSETELTP